MKYLHTMVRVENIDASLDFYCNKLGLKEVRRVENEKGRFTLIFLAAENSDERTGLLELTYNWDPEKYSGGRNFGHFYTFGDICHETLPICFKRLNNFEIHSSVRKVTGFLCTNVVRRLHFSFFTSHR